MIKLVQNFFKRNYWLPVVVLILLLLLMMVRVPAGPRGKVRDWYDRLDMDDPFQVLSPTTPRPPEKVMHVAFLKVHKSGSTTAQNIFLRFGWSHGLTFVLPPAKNAFKYPNIISLRESLTKNNTLPPPSGKHYEMLCNHVIYDSQAFQQFLPNDTFYVGIMREPYEMFKSTLNYLKPAYIYNKIKTPQAASEYLRDPRKYEPKSPKYSFTNNRMSVEFGCPDSVLASDNREMALEFVRQIDKEFDLVIIAELFDESIVLMRRMLKWSTKDILYLDKNIARHKNETSLVGPYDRQLYKKWSKVDYAMYDHFYRRLRQQIRDEGFDFDDELLYFNEVRKMTSEFCRGAAQSKTEAKLVVQKSRWGEKFEITQLDCLLLEKMEIPFIQMIRMRQYGSVDI